MADRANVPPHIKYPRYARDSSDRQEDDEIKLTPSMLLQGMSATTAGTTVNVLPPWAGRPKPPRITKLLDLADNTCAATSSVPLDEPLFQPSPMKLHFSEFEPFGEQKQTLWFRNNDTVPRRLRIIQPDSHFFSINPNPRKADRVAAGMEMSFVVTFRPNEIRDYELDLVCVTEREEFIVKISASGSHSYLDFPDQVLFGQCPVRYASERTFLVRNRGQVDTRFVLEASAPFSVSPRSGFVSIGQGVQVTVTFNPDECVTYNGELKVVHEDGRSAFVQLSGSAENVNVRLDKPVVRLDPAYITLASVSTFKVRNRSNIPVKFRWKAFSTIEEEAEEQDRLHNELQILEKAELEGIEMSVYQDEIAHLGLPHTQILDNVLEGSGMGSLSEYSQQNQHLLAEDSNEVVGVSLAKMRDLATVTVKYKNLHKAVDDDAMLFGDECFFVEPMQGEIWPNVEMEFRAMFRPQTAADYACVACLDLCGREVRLPVKLLGTGIGPKAAFTYDFVDVGDVFVNSKHHYELVLENYGDIDCSFNLKESHSAFAPRFTFSPTAGKLAPGDTCEVGVDFSSSMLGEFAETFVFEMQGSNAVLRVHFKGSVVGPTFHADIDNLAFGRIAYGFQATREFNIYNTSDIPMTFRLRIPKDGKALKKEFEVSPQAGTIKPKESIRVSVDFCSLTVSTYDMFLTVDVEGWGEDRLCIPIHAECAVPQIELVNPEDEFRFGDCFIHHPYTHQLKLRNVSDLAGKFQIMRQDEVAQAVAVFEPDVYSGTIPPMSEISVELVLNCERLGNISLPLYVKITGSEAPPLMGTVMATCKGPNVTLTESTVEWGSVTCLKRIKRTLHMHNDSEIPASFKAFLKNVKTRFELSVHQGCLAPDEKYDFDIFVNADDSIMLRDTLNIVVSHGKHLIIPLVAKGAGTTMFCNENLRVIDLGNVFTMRAIERTFIFENRGRRRQSLQWSNPTHKQRVNERGRALLEIERLKREKSSEAKTKLKNIVVPDEMPAVFSVFPPGVELKPMTGCKFTLTCESTVAGSFMEQLLLEAKVGKEKKLVTVIKSEVKAEIVVPFLKASSDLLEFEYTYEKDKNDSPILRQMVSLRNVTALELNFILRTAEPFNVETFEFCLAPDEEVEVAVLCDPGFKDDRESQVIEGKLFAMHQNHPQKDQIDLRAVINYPNIEFSTKKVDFGCILTETSRTIQVTITNSSCIDTEYSWAFADDDGEDMNMSSNPNRLPIRRVFDILPIAGKLSPGEQQVVEFEYSGHQKHRYEAIALCDVAGGPTYQLDLSGEASQVVFKLDRELLDFGEILYNVVVESEFTIHNMSKVGFSYCLLPSHDNNLGFIECSPTSGRIGPKESQRIVVRLCLGKPDKTVQNIRVEIAHLEPFEFPVYSNGIFTCVSMSLPRLEDSSWEEALVEARSGKSNKNGHQPTLKQLSVEGPSKNQDPMIALEAEADRVHFLKFLHGPENHVDAGALRTPEAVPDGNPKSPKRRKGKSEGNPKTKRGKGKGRANGAGTESVANSNAWLEQQTLSHSDFVVGKYVANFGNVVAGSSNRKRTFRLTNYSSQSVSFDLDRSSASTAGFSVEPSKVVRLPENDSVDFAIHYNARKDAILGPVQVVIPIRMKHGPTVHLLLRANVTIPEVVLNTDMLDFNRILVGQCRVQTLQLHNTSPVTADWAFRSGVDAAKNKDLAFFVISPESGTIAPGKSMNLEVAFTPRETRAYNAKMLFKVNQNPRTKHVTCKGEASDLRMQFTPSSISLPPCLPYSDPIEGSFKLMNLSDRPIEVCSIDFDGQLAKEETILARYSGFSQAGGELLRFPPRLPGDGLPHAVLMDELDRKRVEIINARIEARAAAAEAGEESPDLGDKEDVDITDDGVGELELIGSDPLFAALRTSAGETDANKKITYRMRGLALDVFVHGPPGFGCEKLATAAASRYDLAVTTINQVVEWAVTQDDGSTEDALLPLDVRAHYGLGEPIPVAKGKKNKAVATREMDGPLLAAILKAFVAQEQCGQGVVFHSLSTKYAPSTDMGIQVCIDYCKSIDAKVEVSSDLEPSEEDTEDTIVEGDEVITEVEGSDDVSKTQPEGKEMDGPKDEKINGSEHEEQNKNKAVFLVVRADEATVKYTHDMLRERAQDVLNGQRALLWDSALIDSDIPDVPPAVPTATPNPKHDEEKEQQEQQEEQKEEEKSKEKGQEEEEVQVQPPVVSEARKLEVDEFLSCLDTLTANPELVTSYFTALAILDAAVEISTIITSPQVEEKKKNLEDISEKTLEEKKEQEEQGEEQREAIPSRLDVTSGENNATTLVVHNAELESGEAPEPIWIRLCNMLPRPGTPLPDPNDHSLAIPPASLHQLVRKPGVRNERAVSEMFSLFTVLLPGSPEDVDENAPTEEVVVETVVKGKTKKAAAAVVETKEPEIVEPQNVYSKRTRWVIEAHGTIELAVRFSSQRTGMFEQQLAFEIVGGRRQYLFSVKATCAIPTISTDPRNVFMTRSVRLPRRQAGASPESIALAQAAANGRKFVPSTGTYDFGPLLIGKQQLEKVELNDGLAEETKEQEEAAVLYKKAYAQLMSTNGQIFRISNSGILPIEQVDFSLLNGLGARISDDKFGNTPFVIEPQCLSLDVGETKEITVFALPQDVSDVKDVVVASIKDNPDVAQFPVSCFGAKPTISLHGSWNDPHLLAMKAKDALNSGAPEGADSPKKKKEAASKKEPLATNEPLLDFDRLLLNNSEERSFTIKNTNAIPVAWRLDTGRLEAELGEFAVSPQKGILVAGASAHIAVNFLATTQVVYDEIITVIYSDTEGGIDVEERTTRVPVRVKAEAYNISVSVKFEGNENEVADDSADAEDVDEVKARGTLDFGALRVFEAAARSMSIKNVGKYAIRYEFHLKKKSTRQLFKVEPSSAELQPDEEGEITVTFDSAREVSLQDFKGITCVVLEVKTGEVFETFDVPIQARSVFSRVSLQPRRSVNFGAVKYGTAPERFFELRNDSEFEVSFRVVAADIDEQIDRESISETELLRKLALPDMEMKTIGEANLTVGSFVVTPSGGMIAPSGGVVRVALVFNAEGQNVSRDKLVIQYSGRDPSEFSDPSDVFSINSQGVPLVLLGESCTPGINVDNLESIFEEQVITRSGNNGGGGVGGSGGGGGGATGRKSPSQSNASLRSSQYNVEAGTFEFGAVIPSCIPQQGVSERFKISNPRKVKANVSFLVEPRDDESANAFVAVPEKMELSPHEQRHVTIYFKPIAMREYAARFRAQVEDHVPDESEQEAELAFELRGEGTLPCVTVLKPSELRDDAKLLINFDQLLVGKIQTEQLVLRNDGIVPASIRLDLSNKSTTVSPFTLPPSSTSITLEPGQGHTVALTFSPVVAGTHEMEILLRVLHNEYEMTKICVTGTSFKNDLTLEDMPFAHGDALDFGDVPMQQVSSENSNLENEGDEPVAIATKTLAFSLKNHCGDILRYEFGKHDNIMFYPGLGHLGPYGFETIEVTFRADTPVSLVDELINIECAKIKYNDEAFEQSNGQTILWSERAKESRLDGETQQMQEVVLPEPAYDVIETIDPLTIKCRATADLVQLECDNEARSASFRETMMFQSRVHRFTLRNPAKVALNYSWKVENTDENNQEMPFTFVPSEGCISSETEEVITIRFAPMDAKKFEAIAECIAEGLTDNTPPLIITLNGFGKRPVCHFDVEPSCYLEDRMHLSRDEEAAATAGATSAGALQEKDRPNNTSGGGGNTAPVLLDLSPATLSAVRVVEISSLGVRVKNTKRFDVVNPTNVAYEYVITPVGERHGRFKCVTSRGKIEAGRRCELAFEFSPVSVQLQESLWEFSVPAFGVTQQLLVVGNVVEPRVVLDRKHIQLNAVLVGGHATEKVRIVNHEAIPFGFEFDPSCLIDTNTTDQPSGGINADIKVLSIVPMQGTVPAEGELVVEVRFAPKGENSYNFNLICNVRRKPERLALNVKGEGSAVHDELLLVDDEALLGGQEPITLSSSGSNALDFGPTHINDTGSKTVILRNNGRFNFDFSWTGKNLHPSLRWFPQKGTVPTGGQVQCKVEFNPTAEMVLSGTILECLVAGARKYAISVTGRGAKPALSFSFFRHDFGPCFVLGDERMVDASETAEEGDMSVLRIANNEREEDVAFDCLYERNVGGSVQVECSPTVLKPGRHVDVLVSFSPRTIGGISETLPFEINGLYVVNVLVTGEGVPLKLELERPENQLVNFGALRVRQQVSRHVKLVNRSKRAVAFVLEDKGKRMEEVSVTIGGAGREVHLRPRESYTIDLEFRPMHRLTQFSEELSIRVASGAGINGASSGSSGGGGGNEHISVSHRAASRPLLTVTGACQGAEVTIESDSLTFGSVCEGCFYTRKLQIQNAGDVGTAFRWDASRALGAHFSISPKDGFLPPHSQLMFDVTFKPMALSEDLRCDSLCLVEGGGSLALSLSGACMPQPKEGVQELKFESKVRMPQTKQITLNNPTRSAWFLQPTIHNEYWSGAERVEVPALGSAKYDLTFCPLTMTKLASDERTASDNLADNDAPKQFTVERPENHQGSVFFALPNGKSEMYTVLGTASEPDVVDTLGGTSKAKENLVINLPVKNWLKVAQRFDVAIKMEENKADNAKYHFVFKGHNALDVPGRSTRDYRLTFTAYVEGKSQATVRFTNVVTGEYLWYAVEAESTAAGLVGVLQLRAPVRQIAKRVIEIENPLPAHVPVTFPEKWWTCDNPCVRVLKLTDDMTGTKKGKFQVQYRPLVTTVKKDLAASNGAEAGRESLIETELEEHKLTIKCDQLGEFNYTLQLEAVAVGVDKTLHFNTSLGATQEKVFRFTHFVKSGGVEFSCRVGQQMFFAVPDKVKSETTQEWGGREVEIPVRFEPQALGEVRDELVVRSTVAGGGEYRCALKSTCDAPRPKGPVFLQPGREKTINFRNVFGEKKEFRFTVDSPSFVVGKPMLVIEAQKTVTVSVKFVPQDGNKTPGAVMGKLWVDCPEMSGLPPWVFYLRGEADA